MIYTAEPPQKLIRGHLMSSELAMLFVGMGLGKTAACLDVISELLLDIDSIGVLIIAPMRVCNLTWPMEVENWEQFSWLKVANLRTAAGRKLFQQGKAHIYLINYESIPTLVKLWQDMQKKGLPLPYDIAIFDESTKAKNPASKRVNLFRRSIPAVRRQWALTGTPAPNSLLDLFAQVRLIDGGTRLGSKFMGYRKAFFESTDYMEYNWKPKDGAQDTIEERISDITLTLHSKDWLTIPDTIMEDVDVPLGDDLMDQYQEFEKEMVMQLEDVHHITATNAAALISKLLQFTSGMIYDGDKMTHDLHDLKIVKLRGIVKKTHGPVLVACIFKHEQTRIRKAFPQAEFFADATTATKQMELITRWNNGEVAMLVAHPASIGHGLNLQHGGNTLVWMTQTYSRELTEQMICRLVRRGQDKAVTVYRLMCPGTVDEAVAEALEMKADAENRLLKALAMLESFRTRK